jgi:hypothetical protein
MPNQEYIEIDDVMLEDLRRWVKEKWVDVSRKVDGKHPPCGRSQASDASYPKCRPSKKISKATPKTSKSMSKKDKKTATNIKRRAEAPVSTGGGRPPVMTKLKEEIRQIVVEILNED